MQILPVCVPQRVHGIWWIRRASSKHQNCAFRSHYLLHLGLLLLLLAVGTSGASALMSSDATRPETFCNASGVADSMPSANEEAGVGTRLLHEDSHIKVWEMVLQPGELAPLHTHEYPYTFIVQSGSTLEVRGASDEHLSTVTAEVGQVFSFTLEG
ncbi:cupin 2 barrel domain-containing protein, partial [Nannochloropsis gaditana CCMP526]|uniref:cupin 2 barrel domain-containing protein n=1 Tax=Nannochloropsis gaditana (strain CCMP526) TaxID=1093141 RepID=UPI00029F780B